MTDLAYMVRDKWAQQGTAMQRQSAVILGAPAGRSPAAVIFVLDPHRPEARVR
jgi:hypothetical protein